MPNWPGQLPEARAGQPPGGPAPPRIRIGTDIADVARIEQLMSSQPGLAETVFTAGELAYCRRRRKSGEHMAARWAAKEAVLKCLGTGMAARMAWTDIEVVNDRAGQPRALLSGEVAARALALGMHHIAISLSHSGGFAVAQAVLVCVSDARDPEGPEDGAVPQPTWKEAYVMRLEGRPALVTGASRGIGRVIATRLAAEGAAVAVNYRTAESEAHEVVEAIVSAGGRAVALQGDVSEPKEAQELVRRTVEELGGLQILINNAGIVNISSVMGEQGWVGQSNYAASKGAVNAFTRASATELARFGVRVNAVLPGWTPTGLLGSLLEQDRGRNIKRQLPLRDFATAEQVAAAVAFLASDDAGYTTGELLHVDGGWTAQLGLGRPKTEGGR